MDYPKIRLDKLCRTKSGGTPKRDIKQYYNGDILWAKISDLETSNGIITDTEEKISKEGLESINNRIFPKGTIFLALYGSVGKLAIAGKEMATNQAILGLQIIDKQKLNDRYFVRWLENVKNSLLAKARGVTLQNISATMVRELEIPLPSLPEQKRIAAILDKADAIRRKRRESLQLADAFLRSVFLEMFGSAFQHNKWAIKRLSECSEVVSGVTKGRKLDPDKTVFVPYMRVANVQDGFIDLSEIKSIDVLPADVEKFRILKNDILLTEGGDPDKLGRGAVWKYDIKDCIHQNHIFRVRPDFALLESNYLSALIGSSYGKKYFLKNAKQTTGIASINSTQLKNFPVIIPPLSLQTKYAKMVENVEKIKITTEKATEQADELFNSLTQRAFRGEL